MFKRHLTAPQYPGCWLSNARFTLVKTAKPGLYFFEGLGGKLIEICFISKGRFHRPRINIV